MYMTTQVHHVLECTSLVKDISTRKRKCGAELFLVVYVPERVLDTSQSVRADNCAQVNTGFPCARTMIQLHKTRCQAWI